MSMHESSLPDAWVKRIWSEMRATYGAAFDRQWQCPAGVDPVDHVREVMGTWARGLSRFQQAPDAIRYALDNLPANPPNLIEFRLMCNRRPDQPVPALPAPKPDPARVAAELARMRVVVTDEQYAGPKGWAYRLRVREQAGLRLGICQRWFWRAALGVEPGEPA